MAIAISTIGIKISYAFEAVAGTRPTTGYTHIPQMKEIPDLNPAPDTLETTSFDNLQVRSYIPGLKDLSGAQDFTANFTQELIDMWNGEGGVMEQYETNSAAGKGMWMCVDIPDIDKACYIPCVPTQIGLPGASVNEVLETNVSITITGDPVWDTKPTYSDTSGD